MGKDNLSKNILVYVNYCLPQDGYRLSYEKLSDCLTKVSGRNYSIKTLRKELSLLKKEGLVTTRSRYRKPVPILTGNGKLAISTLLSYKKYGPWDGKWRVVVCNIPDSDKKYRQKYQNELADLGFEKISRNVYLSPHGILTTAKNKAKGYALDPYCVFLEADKIDSQERAVEKIWKLDEINDLYRAFNKQTSSDFKIKDNRFWSFQAKQLEGKFAYIYNLDPHLPEQLLPKDWLGEEAYRLYKKIIASY
jgi:phenylacetic acid degradation operon negative regulatory protein